MVAVAPWSVLIHPRLLRSELLQETRIQDYLWDRDPVSAGIEAKRQANFACERASEREADRQTMNSKSSVAIETAKKS